MFKTCPECISPIWWNEELHCYLCDNRDCPYYWGIPIEDDWFVEADTKAESGNTDLESD